jgi:Tfp pilus assembly PilM family ATPase
VATGQLIQFARGVPIGADQLDIEIARQLRITAIKARELRLRIASQAPTSKPSQETSIVSTQGGSAKPGVPRVADETLAVEHACLPLLRQLAKEIDISLRYYGATFPTTPLRQIMFIGGAAADRRMCQKIAAELHMAAHIADPFKSLAMGGSSPNDGGDAVPNTSWAIAIGLSVNDLPKAVAKAA